ncbi:MAG: glycosyltransferase family 39 protein [Planctomycetota bacterium]|nr:glycosyltransferase family 39 protein [Planctomycetota bacterium]
MSSDGLATAVAGNDAAGGRQVAPSIPGEHSQPLQQAHGAPVRLFHLLLLALLLIAGLLVRARGVVKEPLWVDEYWSMYLSTARAQVGTSVFAAPLGVVIDRAPPISFSGAPGWWHIWTGLSSCVHPPIYFIFLRWWVDLFGDSDLSLRGFSVTSSLAAIVLLFDVVRRAQGPWAGLIAAGMMTFAVSQLDYSQMARGYTFLVAIGLLMCQAMALIFQRGASTGRAIWLGFLTALMALTHYFAVGAIAGLTIYAAIIFRGRDRGRVLTALVIAGLVDVCAWGPKIWASRQLMRDETVIFLLDSLTGIWHHTTVGISAPCRLLLEAYRVNWFAAAPVAVFVFLLPLLNLRRSPDTLMWWLWVVGSLGFLWAWDVSRGTMMLSYLRYIFIASPGIYALLATPAPQLGKLRWALPILMLFCTICYCSTRVHDGPEPISHAWRQLYIALDATAGPNDVIVFTPSGEILPAFPYIAYAHYCPTSKRPVMFLANDPPDAAAVKRLKAGHIWLVSVSLPEDVPRFFPGWRPGHYMNGPIGPSILELLPPS